MPLPSGFSADGEAMYERLPEERADVTRQIAIRERGTDALQTTGRDVPRLKLALLRSRSAPTREVDDEEQPGGQSDEEGLCSVRAVCLLDNVKQGATVILR